MKNIKLQAYMLIALLLVAALLMTACTGGDTPTTDTTDTSASTDTVTSEATDTPEETEPATEAETAPPAELSVDEMKTLLTSAMMVETENASILVKAYMNGEVYSENTITENGDDFLVENTSMMGTERLISVGDKAYYFCSISDGTTVTEMRYVFAPTAEERAELYALYIGEDSSAILSDAELLEGLLNSTLAGERYADGRVKLTCTGMDDSFVELLLGEPMEGATLSFAFTLDAEGRMTFMRFTVTLSAELTGDGEMTITSETTVNYDVAAITAPADSADYAEVTYDDLFGFQLPEIDPDEAASLGLPLDGDGYTVGGESPAVDPELQYLFLYLYAPYYADKTFTIYGNVTEDEYGNILLTMGEDMSFVVFFDGIAEPTVGSYVKVTAAFTQTVDMGDYMDFDCFTMMATSCETLGEAKGPNGGKLMYITASSLNVRSTPDSSVNDNKVGLLSNGDMVEVLETGLGSNSNWCKIIFDCDQGYAYISMSYISETKP